MSDSYIEVKDGCIVIEGIRYSHEFFRDFGHAQIGTVVQITQREDGVVTLFNIHNATIKNGIVGVNHD